MLLYAGCYAWMMDGGSPYRVVYAIKKPYSRKGPDVTQYVNAGIIMNCVTRVMLNFPLGLRLFLFEGTGIPRNCTMEKAELVLTLHNVQPNTKPEYKFSMYMWDDEFWDGETDIPRYWKGELEADPNQYFWKNDSLISASPVIDITGAVRKVIADKKYYDIVNLMMTTDCATEMGGFSWSTKDDFNVQFTCAGEKPIYPTEAPRTTSTSTKAPSVKDTNKSTPTIVPYTTLASTTASFDTTKSPMLDNHDIPASTSTTIAPQTTTSVTKETTEEQGANQSGSDEAKSDASPRDNALLMCLLFVFAALFVIYV